MAVDCVAAAGLGEVVNERRMTAVFFWMAR
jgi:hypothetical protein